MKTRNKETSLAAVLTYDLRGKNSRGWTIKKMRAVVRAVEKGVAVKRIAVAAKMSVSGTKNLIHELKKAASANYTLEKYHAAGRPFAYGRKVLAKKGEVTRTK